MIVENDVCAAIAQRGAEAAILVEYAHSLLLEAPSDLTAARDLAERIQRLGRDLAALSTAAVALLHERN